MHPFDRLYLVAAWSYMVAFHLTVLSLSTEGAQAVMRLWQDNNDH